METSLKTVKQEEVWERIHVLSQEDSQRKGLLEETEG